MSLISLSQSYPKHRGNQGWLNLEGWKLLTRCLVSRPILSVLTASSLIAAVCAACLGGPAETIQEDHPGETAALSDAVTDLQSAGRPGVSGTEVLFGQSAAFTGPAQELGKQMRLGIEAAFHEANQAGGIHGRQLKLKSMDDAYEDDFAYTNTEILIENSHVFALIGAVGTPTARAASPLAHSAGVPFLAPFTGAEFLRDPRLDNVLNVRASYYQETEEMVARLTEDLGVTRISVLYQNDSYGLNGLEGTRLALERRGLEPVGSWHYERNTSAVKGAALKITEANPEAVIMIGSYAPVVRTIELVRRELDPVFMAVSFVGSNVLADALGEDGAGVYVTQVVPLPQDGSNPVVTRYHDALSAYEPKAEPGFVSLEGYLAGRLAVVGLQVCGRELSRECFLQSLHAETIVLDGIQLNFGPDDNQGSDEVFLTVIGADGKYHQVDDLNDTSWRNPATK